MVSKLFKELLAEVSQETTDKVHNHLDFLEGLDELVQAIKKLNGTTMLIGGAVIDSILNLEIKDWDIEVFGLSFTQLESLLLSLGLPVNMVGKSFGIIKTVINGVDIDISIPRRENRIGVGHTDFSIELDETMTPYEAGLRRDLTINSMYKDLLTGEIVDPFNGLADLEAGIIRHTNNATFIEDPLRVLRIMQLLPRKGKIVATETIELCKSITNEFNSIPKERVMEEFTKLLLKAKKPSIGLEFLRECDWLKHFPELYNLIGCEQNPEWYPEGDVWTHTMMVLDNAAILRDEVPEEWRLTFMFGALLHDIGKPATTTEDLRSNGYDTYGATLVPTFMNRLTNETKLIENVQKIVELHMLPGQFHRSGAKLSAWKRLHNKFRLDLLGWQSKADSNGRTGRNLLDRHEPSELCFKYCEEFGLAVNGEKNIKPLVQGRDLIELGLKPSPLFGILLAEAYELQLEGFNRQFIINNLKTKI